MPQRKVQPIENPHRSSLSRRTAAHWELSQEKRECERSAERKSSVQTVISSTHPVPLGKREGSGLEPEKVKRKGVG